MAHAEDETGTPGTGAHDEEAPGEQPGLLERLRRSSAGTNDPNIVGDAGPFDVPPGSDPLPPDQRGPAGLPLLTEDEAGTAVV